MCTLAKQQYEKIAEQLIPKLQKNKFEATYVSTKEEALQFLLDHIPTDVSVGFGGSATLGELGIDEALACRGNTVYNHNRPGLTPEEMNAYRHNQLSCHTFLTSTNALTLNGELVNKDGTANRVAAMMFGPQQVFIVVGMNKLTTDIDSALKRIELEAAPRNNMRLQTANPCTRTGTCVNCQLPTRICNVTTIMHRKPGGIQIHILLVGESLGF